MARFILSDESVNRHGYRVLTAGIDLTAFKKNPVMLWRHDSWSMPIGKWEDIKVEGGKLTAEAVFDTNDENKTAQLVKSQVDQGILNACSIGFDVVTLSEDVKLLVKGQTRPTVSQSELTEASICPIPGNRNALKLSFRSQGLTLSDEDKVSPEQLNFVLPTLKPQMKGLLTTLGLLAHSVDPTLTLSADATEEQASEFVRQLSARIGTKHGEQLLAVAEKAGLITDANRDRFKRLMATNPTLALEFLEAPAASATPAAAAAGAPPKRDARLADVLSAVQNGAAGGAQQRAADTRADWSIRRWEKEAANELAVMRRDDPERYQTLFDAHYKRATV